MIITKLPDFEGGFITTSLEGKSVITRSAEGNVLDEEPVNLLMKGMRYKGGTVEEYADKVVIIKKSLKAYKADKDVVNADLLQDFNIDEGFYKSPASGRLIERENSGAEIKKDFDDYIAGEYKTPLFGLIVKIKPTDFRHLTYYGGYEILKHIKQILTNPDEIREYASEEAPSSYLFVKNGAEGLYCLTVSIEGAVEGGFEIKDYEGFESYSETIYKNGKLLKETRPEVKIIKKSISSAFMIGKEKKIKKAMGLSKLGFSGSKKGMERPGHKYIMRKPNPSGEGYIYLYELPGGERQWSDEEGKAVKAGAEDVKLPELKPGDIIKQGPVYGKIVEIGSKIIAVEYNGKIRNIDKDKHVQKVAEHSRLKLGQDIEHKGGLWKIVHLSDNLALLKDASGHLELIQREKEIVKVDKIPEQERSIDKHSYVYQGYGDMKNKDADYKKREIYKDGIAENEKLGYKQVNDNKYIKYAELGGEDIKISRVYYEWSDKWEIKVNEEKQEPLLYNGEKYYIDDIDEKGDLRVLNVRGSELETIRKEDYEKYLAEKEKPKNEPQKLHIHYEPEPKAAAKQKTRVKEYEIKKEEPVKEPEKQDLVQSVQKHFNGKYTEIPINPTKEETGNISLRISDHSGKRDKDRSGSDFLFDVIIGKDPTKDKHYNPDDSYDYQLHFDETESELNITRRINLGIEIIRNKMNMEKGGKSKHWSRERNNKIKNKLNTAISELTSSIKNNPESQNIEVWKNELVTKKKDMALALDLITFKKKVKEPEKKKENIEENKDFITGREELQKAGYEVTENKARYKKKTEVEGNKFEIVKFFRDGEWKTEIMGKIKTLKIGDKEFPIDDVSKDGLTYLDEGKKKTLSKKELETINGKALFEPTKAGKGLTGNTQDKIYFSTEDKDVIPGTYEIVESKDVVPSHLTGGEQNPDYRIQGAQNRNRQSAQSKAQIASIADKPLFDFLSDSRRAEEGAPIVNEDYNVIAGNGRAIGLQRHYEGTSGKYKNDLIAHAEKFGFDPEEVKKMDKPMLVRRVYVDDKEAQRLGAMSNSDTTKLALEESEAAKGIASRIDDKTIEDIGGIFSKAMKDDPGEKTLSDYLGDAGPEIVNILNKKNLIPAGELNKYMDFNRKNLSPKNKEKLKELLLQAAIGDSSMEFERMKDDAAKGVTRSLPYIMALKGKKGDISKPLNEAVKIAAKFNSSGIKDVKDYIEQDVNNAVDPLKADRKTMAIFDVLVNTKQTDIEKKFRGYNYLLEENKMFEEAKTPEEAFEEVFPVHYPHGVGIKKSFTDQLRSAWNYLWRTLSYRGE
jgi:hypothetical protein